MNHRQKHAPDRREYREANPICEMCKCRPSTEVDHIIQCARSYEMIENYLAVCRECHRKKHSDNLRMKQIAIKKKKGEWNFTPEDEIRIFGKHYF